ncbi:hypothetical protein M5D96_011458, partial [Drosophila gunungcola]
WSIQVVSKAKTTKAPLKEVLTTKPNVTQIANATVAPEKLAEVHIDQHKTIRISKGDLDDLLDVYMERIAENDELLRKFENLTQACSAQNSSFTAALKDKDEKIRELEQKVKIYETRLKRKQHVLTELRKLNTSSALLIDHLKGKVFREKKDDLLADWEAATTTCMPYGRYPGIHLIHLPGFLPFLVACEGQTAAGPGWLSIQRRVDGSVNFYRNWDAYSKGFGKLNGERFGGETSYAHYDDFLIGSAEEGYELKLLGHYQGNASDALRTHDKMKFSTFDRDNDAFTHMNCAQHHQGAWWYDFCSRSNLNGKYFKGEVDNAQSIYWEPWYSFRSLKSVQMLIRPKSQMELKDLPKAKRTPRNPR